MDKALKQRMVGAVVLIALGVIFIPMLLDGGSGEEGTRSVELDIPAAPDREYRSRLLPLDESGGEPADAPRGQVERGSGATPAPPAATPQPAPDTGDENAPAGPDATADGDAGPTAGDEAEPGGPAANTEPVPADDVPASAGQSPEPSPTPEQARQPLGNWFVQVGSFSKQANAVDLRDRLREAGYTAFVETSTVEGQTTHRVKVGPEMERSRAEEQRDAIRATFDLKGIVVSEP